MGRSIDYANAELDMADALRSLVASGGTPCARSHELILTVLTSPLDASVEAGVVRRDTGATDMSAALTGIAPAPGRAGQREQAERLLALTLDGLGVAV